MSVQLYWKRVIFSDETQVVVGHDRRVHAWRKADEIWRPECVVGNILAITGHTLSPRVSKYFVVFIFPSISVNVPTPSKVMHPQNIEQLKSNCRILNVTF
jgi:hypothetical protein